jgi:CPA2 family monovalent cation:H+ antiporter-2
MGIPMRKVVRRLAEAREARYGLLRGYFRGSEGDDFDVNESWRLHTVTLTPGAQAIGQTLEEMNLEMEGVAIQAVRRKVGGEDYVKLPLSPDLRLRENDILVLSGSSDSTDIAESKLL